MCVQKLRFQSSKFSHHHHLTCLLQQLEDAAGRLVGYCSLAFHLILSDRVSRRDLVLRLYQNMTRLIQELENLLGFSLVQFLAKFQLYLNISLKKKIEIGQQTSLHLTNVKLGVANYCKMDRFGTSI